MKKTVLISGFLLAGCVTPESGVDGTSTATALPPGYVQGLGTVPPGYVAGQEAAAVEIAAATAGQQQTPARPAPAQRGPVEIISPSVGVQTTQSSRPAPEIISPSAATPTQTASAAAAAPANTRTPEIISPSAQPASSVTAAPAQPSSSSGGPDGAQALAIMKQFDQAILREARIAGIKYDIGYVETGGLTYAVFKSSGSRTASESQIAAQASSLLTCSPVGDLWAGEGEVAGLYLQTFKC